MSELFAEHLRKLRKKAGITHAKMAEGLGLKDPGTISKWENNRLEPGRDKIVKIAQMFGVTPNYLLGVNETGKSEREIIEEFLGFMQKTAEAYLKRKEQCK